MKNIPELKEKTNFLGAIANFFIQRFRVSYLVVFAIVLFGLLTYQGLPRETMPEVEFSMVMVMVTYPGASPEDMESLVTDPIEDAVGSVDDLDEITSTSSNSSTMILMAFEEGTDMDDALADVNEALNTVTLPDDANDPAAMTFNTSDMPMMQMVVTGDYELTDLKMYGENLQSAIEGVQGISEVEMTGGYDREIQILLSSMDLISYGIKASDVSNALIGTNTSVPAGTTDIDGENYSIRLDEDFNRLEDIENTVVASGQEGTLFVKDVAEVVDSYRQPSDFSYQYIKGEGQESTPAVYLTVYREGGYDMIVPAQEIKEIIENGSPALFPEDISVLITDDQSVEVDRELNNVVVNAVSGFLVVIIVLFLFIGLNESLIVAMIMPLSLLISVMLMSSADMSLNTLSLTGFIIALGLIVDNAIVVMENVDRLRDEGLDRVTASKVGTNQVAPAIFASSLTTIASFLPLATMSGDIGNMINVLPRTVIFTIVASFLMSLSMTPAFCSLFLSKYKKVGGTTKVTTVASAVFVAVLALIAFSDDGRVGPLAVGIALLAGGAMVLKGAFKMRKEKHGQAPLDIVGSYSRWVGSMLQSPWKRTAIFGTALAVLVFCFGLVATGIIKLELFPVEEPDSFYVTVEGPKGYMLEDTDAIVKQAEALLYNYEDIESFNASVGKSVYNPGSNNDGEELANISVVLVDEEERTMSSFEIIEQLREEVKKIPGAQVAIDADTSQGPSSNDIEIILAGNDFQAMDQVGMAYEEILQGIPGVINPSLGSTNGMKEMTISIDKVKAAGYGMTPASIGNEIRQRINGVASGTYKENNEAYDITTYVDMNAIDSVKDFETIYFTTMTGQLVNFYDLASLEIVDGISTISHRDGDREIILSADVDEDHNVNEVMAEFEARAKDVPIPKGVSRGEGGGFRDLNETVDEMIYGYVFALILIYIILVVQFNSLTQPLVIMVSIPLALIGVIMGLLITGNNMGIYAMMGIIALAGIAVNDAIVLIDYINTLRKQGLDQLSSIVEAVKTRFNPVMATSITTIGGVLPLALKSSTYGQLGYALIFGLVTSTLLTLLIIPIVLYSFEKAMTFTVNIRLFRREDNDEKLEA